MHPGPHKLFILPAQHRAELWRLPVGFMLVWFCGILASEAVWPVVSAIFSPAPLDQLVEISGVGRPSSLSTLYILGSFGFFIIGLHFALRFLHQRSLWTLLGDWHIATDDFWRVARAVLILQAVLSAIPSLGPDLIQSHTIGAWVALLPITLFCLMLQVSAEELVFRGYLQQQLSVKFDSRLIWMGVPSVIFGMLHYFPAEQGANAPIIALWAFFFGMAAADLTARSGSLGAAIGMHLANNLMSIVFVTVPGPVAGVALFIYPQPPIPETIDPALIWQFVILWMSWMAARIAIRA